MTGQLYRLRPHHGLCLWFFRGKGYSGEFTANMTREKATLESRNPPVRLTVETDEICAACPNNLSGSCESAEKVARYDREVLRWCSLREGDVLPFLELESRVLEHILRTGQREELCGDCQWSALCHYEREEP